jgi:hypothetical protein
MSALSVHSAAFAFQIGLLGAVDRLGFAYTAAASMGVVGEAVAAVASNHLSLEQAAAVVAETAKAVGRLEAAVDVRTGMLLVTGLTESEIEQLAATEQCKARAKWDYDRALAAKSEGKRPKAADNDNDVDGRVRLSTIRTPRRVSLDCSKAHEISKQKREQEQAWDLQMKKLKARPPTVEPAGYLSDGVGMLSGDRAQLEECLHRLEYDRGLGSSTGGVSMLSSFGAATSGSVMSGPTGTASAALWPPGQPSHSCVALHSGYFDLDKSDFIEQIAPSVEKTVTPDTAFAATLEELATSKPTNSGLGDCEIHGNGGFRQRQWYSSVSGARGAAPTCWRGVVQDSSVSDPANNGNFWFRALRERASAHRALSAAAEDGYRLFLELNSGAMACKWVMGVCRGVGGDTRSVSENSSSHSGRSSSVALPALGGDNAAVSSFDPTRSAGEQLLSSLANMFVNGCDVDWTRAYRRMETGPQTSPTTELLDKLTASNMF